MIYQCHPKFSRDILFSTDNEHDNLLRHLPQSRQLEPSRRSEDLQGSLGERRARAVVDEADDRGHRMNTIDSYGAFVEVSEKLGIAD